MDDTAFDGASESFTILYDPRKSGWTSPWLGYRTEALPASK